MSVRALFLSDTHLGFQRARVRELAEFLRTIEAESIVLAGDIVDALALARRMWWATEHTHVVRSLLARRRAGTRLIYLPGNHDASLSMLAELMHGQIEVHREWVHRTRRGERLLVLHGDQFDHAMQTPAWLSRLGDSLYEATVSVSHGVNDLRRALGRSYYPLAERMKLAVGASVCYISAFEGLAARHARAHGYDGVVCGHIHRANLTRLAGVRYCNTGDWVESCSALVETCAGEIQLRRWPGPPVQRGCATAAALAEAA